MKALKFVAVVFVVGTVLMAIGGCRSGIRNGEVYVAPLEEATPVPTPAPPPAPQVVYVQAPAPAPAPAQSDGVTPFVMLMTLLLVLFVGSITFYLGLRVAIAIMESRRPARQPPVDKPTYLPPFSNEKYVVVTNKPLSLMTGYELDDARRIGAAHYGVSKHEVKLVGPSEGHKFLPPSK